MSFQINIEEIKNIISKNNDKPDVTKFLNILEKASSTLSDGYNDLDDSDGSNDQNAKFYDYAFNLVNNELDSFIKSIENIRSSYLPYEVYSAILPLEDTSTIIQEISKDSTPLESYQNAFYRMIGLPSWEDVNADTPDVTLDLINSNGKLISGAINKGNIEKFLDARQSFSTIGCSYAAPYFDLVGQSTTSDSVLIQGGFPQEAINNIFDFSDIIYKAINASPEDLTAVEAEYSNYIGSLSSQLINEENIKEKVTKIHQTNNSGDPLSWMTVNLNDLVEGTSSELTKKYYGDFLLFIYYGYVDSDPKNFFDTVVIDKLYKNLVEKEITDDSLNNIEKNIYLYSSLLFPMVKDGRISKCINNPEKIVAEPFLPITKRLINGNFLRSSLLESIIRIRTDVISGTTSYANSDIPYRIGEYSDTEVNQESVSGELIGYLESLLIARMLDSLKTLAKNVRTNIEQISVTQRRTGKGIIGSCTDPSASPSSALGIGNTDVPKELIILNNYALIEDSIMMLLGTKDIDEDSLNLQSGINRNSSVPNSHLMSSLVNLVQIPRKYINEKIEKKERNDKTNASAGLRVSKDLEVSIGIRSGIGIIDFIVIVTALLTIDEVNLVSLLTKSQIDNMYRQINKDTFDDKKRKEISETPIYKAVNVLTERVETLYKLFIEFLNN